MKYKITWPNGIYTEVGTIRKMVDALLECQSRGFELHQLKIENFLESETLEGKRENEKA